MTRTVLLLQGLAQNPEDSADVIVGLSYGAVIATRHAIDHPRSIPRLYGRLDLRAELHRIRS
ncbi:hypothetical protein [Nesterenkonia pannonica]|uniref:hypothetical protein n=1 Tax=Nesterenkonia pannonica TaxID=1548602 RepID=UPI002164BE29|nr:hypothetical protein [Nesterenkonia pannonica]